MSGKDDKIDKYVDVCQLYEKLDEKERETLMKVIGKLFEAQSLISKDKARLKEKKGKAEKA